jgi:glycosyltransferase involved in cell wall biosynthesis
MNRPNCKIAFVSPHCLVDFTNGAATATRDALKLLAAEGFSCEAFCGTRMDEPHEGLIQETLARQGIKYLVQKAKIGAYDGRLIFFVDGEQGARKPQALTPGPSPRRRGEHGRVPVTLFENGSTRGGWFGAEEVKAFLTGCEIFLRRNRPDLVWTYGGDEVSIIVQRVAKALGIPVLFFLHNFGYYDTAPFKAVDHIAVPSEFSRAYYRQTLGLDCHCLPYVIDPRRVKVAGTVPVPSAGSGTRSVPDTLADGTRSVPATFVTFVNPQTTKGLVVFARIAAELARRRPDIPLLVIEGRSASGWQRETGIDLARLPNITIRPNTADPRTFYAVSKLLLVPSLWNESFGLVAAEAMMDSIPVLVSNRGALPETIGDAGFLFDIPARYTPETQDQPTAEEVAPWVETIVRLWDDAAEYDRCSRAARARAERWHPDRLAPLYRDFFSRIAHPSGAPLVPR